MKYEIHQLIEEEPLPNQLETDEEMLMDLLQRSYYLVGMALERRLPKGIHDDLAHLHKDLKDALSFWRVH